MLLLTLLRVYLFRVGLPLLAADKALTGGYPALRNSSPVDSLMNNGLSEYGRRGGTSRPAGSSRPAAPSPTSSPDKSLLADRRFGAEGATVRPRPRPSSNGRCVSPASLSMRRSGFVESQEGDKLTLRSPRSPSPWDTPGSISPATMNLSGQVGSAGSMSNPFDQSDSFLSTTAPSQALSTGNPFAGSEFDDLLQVSVSRELSAMMSCRGTALTR